MTTPLRSYLLLNIAGHVAVALPQGAPWSTGGELPWLLLDIVLWRKILQGSEDASGLSVALQAAAAALLGAAEVLEPQRGFVVLFPVALAGLAAGLRAICQPSTWRWWFGLDLAKGVRKHF